MSSNRALGLGLVGLGGVLGGVMLLWLLVTVVGGQTSPEGAVLGLLLAAVLGLPLVGGGLYVLSRGKQEAAAAAEFQTQRRTFESDRLFRAEQARELEQLAERLALIDRPEAGQLARRLRDLVHDLREPSYDQAAWYDAVELGHADLDALKRYDDLLSDGVRGLDDLATRLERDDAALPELGQAIRDWERNAGRRADLLRGRRAPTVAPTEVLKAGRPASTADAAGNLKVGDAVTWDGADYVVETTVSYFVGGRTWWLHRLQAEQDERWLYVASGALSLAHFTPLESPFEPGQPHLEHDGATCRLDESTTAAAEVHTRGGPQSGGSVTIWRYACPTDRLLWLERWPDGTRAYSGRPISPTALEIWPAAEQEHEGGGLP